MALFTRAKGGNILSSLDLLGAIGTIGLFLGRIANFINGELYGAPTTLPWGVIFPTEPDRCRAIPSQLYEACSKASAVPRHLRRHPLSSAGLRRPGLAAGIFGIGYALSRILVEFVRLPDVAARLSLDGWLTMGRC